MQTAAASNAAAAAAACPGSSSIKRINNSLPTSTTTTTAATAATLRLTTNGTSTRESVDNTNHRTTAVLTASTTATAAATAAAAAAVAATTTARRRTKGGRTDAFEAGIESIRINFEGTFNHMRRFGSLDLKHDGKICNRVFDCPVVSGGWILRHHRDGVEHIGEPDIREGECHHKSFRVNRFTARRLTARAGSRRRRQTGGRINRVGSGNAR